MRRCAGLLAADAVQDRVLSDAKSALDDAGMTIPWPARTLVIDTPVTVERNGI